MAKAHTVMVGGSKVRLIPGDPGYKPEPGRRFGSFIPGGSYDPTKFPHLEALKREWQAFLAAQAWLMAKNAEEWGVEALTE